MDTISKKSLRIIFLGTPEFAVASLKALVENQFNVVAVVTMPDKAMGRGYKLRPSAVKQYATSQGIQVLQPTNLKDAVFLEELKALNADLQIVVAFRMLPEAVWNMPRLGTFNLHASLLPQYRGAAPINWAIINGEKETGVTTFFLTHEIDTGKIIFREKTPIHAHDNAGALHDRLMEMGAALVVKTTEAVITEQVEGKPQSDFKKEDEVLKSAPKIFSETCRIDWNSSAHKVYNLIRGLSPYPSAWTTMRIKQEGDDPSPKSLRFKLYGAEMVETKHSLPVGAILTDNKSILNVAVSDGFIQITDLQLQGKRRMDVVDFLNGFQIPSGAHFL